MERIEDSRRDSDLAMFWRLLAQGFCEGMQLLPLLRSIGQQLPAEPIGRAVAAMADDIDAGATLSAAMGRQPAVFSKAHICLIEGGEYVGRLDRIAVLILELTWTCPSCGHLRCPGSG
jgi:type IV pilus assembly protein PilC